MILRPARLALVAALPLLAVAACSGEPREPRLDSAADARATAASGLRQSIETAVFRPAAPSGADDAATTGSTAQTAQTDRGGVVSDGLPADARPDPAMVRAHIRLKVGDTYRPGLENEYVKALVARASCVTSPVRSCEAARSSMRAMLLS